MAAEKVNQMIINKIKCRSLIDSLMALEIIVEVKKNK